MTEKVMNHQIQFSQSVEEALARFLLEHQAHLPNNLHNLAIQSIERPLLKKILCFAENNQSYAAKILGLNRATLKKKLLEYGILDSNSGDN